VAAASPSHVADGLPATLSTPEDTMAGDATLRLVQAKINSLGYSPALVVDGIAGQKTTLAIMWVRQKLGLGPGGLDSALLSKLGISTLAPGPSPTAAPTSDFAPLAVFAQKYGQTVSQGSGIAPGFQATRASVVDSFIPWSGPFEGPLLPYPYTDVDGWVTTGTGNMIDAGAPGQRKGVNCGKGTSTPCGQATPTAKARSMPWAGGSIDADWAAIKAAWPHTQSTACAGITHARLPQAYLVQLATDQMKANERDILRLVPNFAQIPADGQLALHSMCWAMGTGALATYKTLLSAVNSGDFATAAAQSHMHGDGIDMRNLANKLLFTNAAAIKAAGLPFDHLYYLSGLSLIPGTAGAGLALGLLGKALPGGLSSLGTLGVVDLGFVVGGMIVGGMFLGAPGAIVGGLIGAGLDLARRVGTK
jgi:GH24 family phage-related lysozyme (muramidase)